LSSSRDVDISSDHKNIESSRELEYIFSPEHQFYDINDLSYTDSSINRNILNDFDHQEEEISPDKFESQIQNFGIEIRSEDFSDGDSSLNSRRSSSDFNVQFTQISENNFDDDHVDDAFDDEENSLHSINMMK